MNDMPSKDEMAALIQRRYPANELLNAARNLIGISSLSDVGRENVLLHSRHAKPLVEEMLRIGYLCKHLPDYFEGKEIKCVIGNQQHDAVVFDAMSEEPERYIEVVSLEREDTYKERRELFEIDSQKNGGYVDGIISISEIYGRFLDRLKGKSEINYPPSTILLMFVEPNIDFGTDFDDYFRNATSDYRSQLDRFVQVVVMNESNIYLNYRRPFT